MRKFICGICLLVSLTGTFWAQEKATAHVKILTESVKSWDGAALPGYPEGTPEITILRIQIPPSVQLPMHEHPVINAGVLLSGELTVVTKDSDTLHLKAGDPIVEVVDTWHYGMNEGNETAEIIVFYAGVEDSSITIKK